MSRSRFTNVAVFAILILEFCGCASLREVPGVVAYLDKVWDSIYSTSDAHRSISVLGLDRQMICEIEGFASSGSRLHRIYRLAGAYVFEVRDADGGTSYSYVKRDCNESMALRNLTVAANQYLNINISASRLRFAPISRLGEDSFNEIWDSKQDAVLSVPAGFVGRVQCGGGIFLLERESNGGLYVWIPDSPSAPKEWKYKWLWHGSSASFFVAENADTGVRHAFVGGLTLVPGSEGAESIICGCISNGKQRYEIFTADGKKVVYILNLSDVGHSLKGATPNAANLSKQNRGGLDRKERREMCQ